MLRKLWNKVVKPRRTHYRVNGPVVINPDIKEVIHVKGNK